MSKIQDSETAVPFDDLIIELFNNHYNKSFINDIYTFVIKHKKDYSLVHLYTLTSTCIGYLEKIKLTR